MEEFVQLCVCIVHYHCASTIAERISKNFMGTLNNNCSNEFKISSLEGTEKPPLHTMDDLDLRM